ncbi:MAG: hypothetical protein KA259_02710 [Caldilineaceae bacterium]|nr:hypothetical protein [Caldilineaceae bacterium]
MNYAYWLAWGRASIENCALPAFGLFDRLHWLRVQFHMLNQYASSVGRLGDFMSCGRPISFDWATTRLLPTSAGQKTNQFADHRPNDVACHRMR